MKRVLAIDIGGQGLKMAWFARESSVERVSDVWSYSEFDREHFGAWLARAAQINGKPVAVSCSGFVDSRSGIVTGSGATGWSQYPLTSDLIRNGASSAFLLNDGEAHLFAHVDECHPILAISLGTAVGVAVTDELGEIFRPRIGRNIDVGDMRLVTSSARKLAWEGLGAQAHAELVRQCGREAGTTRYGQRVGAFAAQLANVFQPKTVILSGGLVEQDWPILESAARTELSGAIPPWLLDLELKRSRHGALAALRGIAGYAFEKARS